MLKRELTRLLFSRLFPISGSALNRACALWRAVAMVLSCSAEVSPSCLSPEFRKPTSCGRVCRASPTKTFIRTTADTETKPATLIQCNQRQAAKAEAVFSLSDAHIGLPMLVFVRVDLDRFPSRATALFCRAGLGDCNNGLMYLRPLSFWTIVWLNTFDTYRIRHGPRRLIWNCPNEIKWWLIIENMISSQ